MSVFDKARERFSLIKALSNFQKSIFYPILFGTICTVSALSNIDIYLPLTLILSISVVFGTLFTDDLKFIFVPFIMIYYSIGMDFGGTFTEIKGEILGRFAFRGLIHFLICGIVMVICLIYRLIVSGAARNIFKRCGSFLWGILILDVAFMLNGVLSPVWDPRNLFYGALNAFVLTAVYLIFVGVLSVTENAVPYLCKVMVCFGYMIFAQTLILCAKLYINNQFFLHHYATGEIIGIDRGNIFFSWGIPTIIGAAVVLAIPSAFYLAKNHRFGLFYYISAFVFLGMTFVINTRSASLCGAFVTLVCIIICCFSGKNRKANSIFTLAILIISIIVGLIMIKKFNMTAIIKELLAFFRFDKTEDVRLAIWEHGWEVFKGAPYFGTGFVYDGNIDRIVFNNIYSNMYHNIIVEMFATMGILGALGFLIHLLSMAKVFFVRFSADKMLVLMTPILILIMSLFDNFFFYPNFQIVYAIFFAVADTCFYKKKKEIML